MNSLTNKRLAGLDFLRAMAILLVFLWHYRRYGSPGWLDGISKLGWTGVDLFFVLSGYLIGSQLFVEIKEKQQISLKRFYLKRFFRIIPAYLCVLIIYFTVPQFREREHISPLWKFLTFTMNFGLDYQNCGAFSHAWSLCIEEQFYLIFPLILLILYKLNKPVISLSFILFLFLSGFLIRAYSWETFVAPEYSLTGDTGTVSNVYSEYIYYPTYNRLDGLLSGLFIALLYSYSTVFRQKADSFASLLFVTGVIILFAVYFLCSEPFSFFTAVFSYPMISIGYGLIVISALNGRSVINRVSTKVFSLLAVVSYSMYLTHKPLNHIVQALLSDHHLNKNIIFVICLAVSIAGGVLLYVIIEKPFLKLRNYYLNK